MVAVRKISSDCTSLSYTIEESITKLPANPVWKLVSPTSYSGEFGANVEYMVDEPIGSGRSTKKGIPVNKTVPAGFESSVRQEWLQPFLPGFFFNHAIETPNTNTFNRTSSSATLTGVTATAYTGTGFTAANGFSSATDSQLLYASGFAIEGNNGLKQAGTIQAASITATGLTAESSPPEDASLEVCGVIVDDNAPVASVSGSELTIVSSSLAVGGPMQVAPGTFIHIGGDASATRYANDANSGWARVKRVTSTGIVCDLTTFNAVAIASPASTIRIFVPTRIYKDNITCDDSLRTTYQLERRLGKADTTDTHEQSQLITGAVCNQLDLAIPTGDKVMATLAFVAAESYRRKGDTAPWSGNNRRPIDLTSLYNTSFDIKYGQIYKHDTSTTRRETVFGLVTDGTFTLNNNCSPIPGWGVYGAYDINTGKLDINADVTALFTTVEALDLAEEGLDAGLFVVFARGNSGFILDIPLLTVQASPLAVAVNEPITVSLSNAGNESSFGYAASLQFFDYLPTYATN